MLVALYGTLKVGYCNYELHLRGERPTRTMFVSLPFEMYANDAYPMLVPAASARRHPIWVEIFDVDDAKLRELDALEEPYGYWREQVFIEEIEKRAGLYVHTAPAPEEFVRVPGGRWPG